MVFPPHPALAAFPAAFTRTTSQRFGYTKVRETENGAGVGLVWLPRTLECLAQANRIFSASLKQVHQEHTITVW